MRAALLPAVLGHADDAAAASDTREDVTGVIVP